MVNSARTIRRFSTLVGSEELVFETGKYAEQAGGAVTLRVGDTVVFASATMSNNVREGLDFFPLSVDYEEKLYAAGRIPGSFYRREGRPSETAILTSRVVDRTLRPLFQDDMRNEVQVILMSLSHDQEHHTDMLGIIAASCAVLISNIPWDGPVAGVRIGLINDKLVVNPTHSQMENSTLDLRVSGTADALNMVECGAQEVDEATMVEALELAHSVIRPLCELQNQIRAEVGKEKSEVMRDVPNTALFDEIAGKIRSQIRQIITEHTDRDARGTAIKAISEALVAEYETRNATVENDADKVTKKQVNAGIEQVMTEEVRERIVNEGIRPDGRNYVTIRPLSSEVTLIPRVHGSGLFSRGQTQVLSIVTLGTPSDSQEMDGLAPDENKRYMHHYNMPPYSTGEAYPLRGPKRREIGHGALAETALRYVIPSEDVFPYTLRVVSEVMSSNGSTSMASVCASTLALMDAGVPIIRPVAGIAMGLIKEGDKVAVLTDIQGLEDHIGDMDFKVAGTERGITALQMDIKITGVSGEVMKQALAQAHDARMQILAVMRDAIAEPRSYLSDYAPRMITLKIDPEKIGAVIGPGGKIVRGIQERLGIRIDIQDDGTVFVSGVDGPSVEKAVAEVRGLVEEAEPGKIYTGRVTRIEPYGVFVEILPNKEGMVHVSQLSDHPVSHPEDEVHMADEIMVMVVDVDPSGKVRLSRQAVLLGWTLQEARDSDKKGGERRSSGGGDRRGGGGGGGYRGGGGGDRNRSGGGNSGGSSSGGGNSGGYRGTAGGDRDRNSGGGGNS
ncbi:MAG: polyribonucleotide nucleotidyltransferase [Phototrophicales bacterium]|nr:polyribonucleotide nucleotidyltransferase [Phototrophicales bacterium]